MEEQIKPQEPQVTALEQWKSDVSSVDRVLHNMDNIITSAESGTITVNRHFIQLARQTKIMLQRFDSIVGMVIDDINRVNPNSGK